ncbi:MAG: hypothetical protein ACI3XC_07690, partial [Phascolarctobacterium sp.]
FIFLLVILGGLLLFFFINGKDSTSNEVRNDSLPKAAAPVKKDASEKDISLPLDRPMTKLEQSEAFLKQLRLRGHVVVKREDLVNGRRQMIDVIEYGGRTYNGVTGERMYIVNDVLLKEYAEIKGTKDTLPH